MTAELRSVEVSADVAYVASLTLDEQLRGVPVLDNESLVGIISRRDLLRSIVRTDAAIRGDLERLVDSYTGAGWVECPCPRGVATMRRTRGAPEVEQRIMQALPRTVGGVVEVRVPEQERTRATHDPS